MPCDPRVFDLAASEVAAVGLAEMAAKHGRAHGLIGFTGLQHGIASELGGPAWQSHASSQPSDVEVEARTMREIGSVSV
jgi:hypothetical protein